MTDKPAIEGGSPVREEFLGFHRASIGPEEERAVIEVLRSGWLTTGKRAFELEEKVARMCGASHAVAVNSCTSSLHLALVCLNIGPGDEVITTPTTFASTTNVIEHLDAKPVFVDISLADLNIDPTLIEGAITDKTRAIMPVHMAGIPCDMDPIMEIANKRGLPVIEDAAHALGAFYKDRPIGSISTITCFSFYATKNITTAEGGMLVTNDEKLAERARLLRLHGMSKDAWKRYGSSGFQHWEILGAGFKYNMPDVLAAIGVEQIIKFDAFQKRRGKIVAEFDRAFSDEPALKLLSIPEYAKSAYHIYPVMVDLEKISVDRDRIMDAIQKEGIGVAVHFRSVPEHPYYREKYGYKEGTLPNAEKASRSLITLPLYPGLSDGEVQDIITATKKVVSYYRR